MRPGVLLGLRGYATLVMCVALLALAVVFAGHFPLIWAAAWILAALCLLGLYDLVQSRHSILRNYPVIGHVRWIAELVRPEIRQYLIEADEEAAPFSRSQRSLVYERAKGEAGEHPFGTLLDVYRDGYEFIGHSTAAGHGRPTRRASASPSAAPQCARPYSASVFNISAMSFGSLSANAIRALNAGAQARRLQPRHRRGQHLALPPGDGRRHRLGGGQRLLRLPHAGRPLRPRPVRRAGPARRRSR